MLRLCIARQKAHGKRGVNGFCWSRRDAVLGQSVGWAQKKLLNSKTASQKRERLLLHLVRGLRANSNFPTWKVRKNSSQQNTNGMTCQKRKRDVFMKWSYQINFEFRIQYNTSKCTQTPAEPVQLLEGKTVSNIYKATENSFRRAYGYQQWHCSIYALENKVLICRKERSSVPAPK